MALLRALLARLVSACTVTLVPLCETHTQVVDIVYLEGMLFRTFKSLMLQSTQQAASEAMKPRTFVCFEPSIPATEMFCHKLKIHNRLMGFAYLVDWTGKVRWRYA